MNLVPYTITALAESDAAGTGGRNIVIGAVVTLQTPAGGAVTLHDDAAGANPSTAKTTGAKGQVVVFVEPGEYRVFINGNARGRAQVAAGRPVTAVDSVDDLRLQRGRFNGDTVQLLSYHAGLNKGGGVFTWDTSSTAADDNGVTFAVAGVATGRWVRVDVGNERRISWFGAIGSPDEDAAPILVSAASSLSINQPLNLVIDDGIYYFKSTAHIDRGDVQISCQGSEIIVTDPSNYSDPSLGAVLIGQAEAKPVTGSGTTVTADIVEGVRQITVTNSAGFNRGDIIRILSGTGLSNGEWFFGPDNDAGNRATKSELNVVIGKPTGTSLLLANATAQSYNATDFTVHVDKCMPFKNVIVKNMVMRGDITASQVSTAADFPRGIVIKGVKGVNVSGCQFFNFTRYSLVCDYALDVAVDGNNFLGQDLSLDGNYTPDGEPSIWFTASNFVATANLTFSNNTAANVRRIIDFHGSGIEPVSRNCLVIGNVSTNCFDVAGSHVVDRVSYIGNKGYSCRNGIQYRGRNAVIKGNYLEVRRNALIIGSTTLSGGKLVQTNPFNTGYCIVQNNDIIVMGDEQAIYFSIKCDWDYLKLSGNTFRGMRLLATQMGSALLSINGVLMGNTEIIENTVDTSLLTGFCRPVDVRSFTEGDIKFMGAFNISRNTFINGDDGIRIAFPSTNPAFDGVPAESFVISGNSFIGIRARLIRLTDTNASLKTPIVIKSNIGYGTQSNGTITGNSALYISAENTFNVPDL